MEYDIDLINSIHDIYYNCYHKKLSNDEIVNIIYILPKEILSIGEDWGYWDTEFGDGVFNFLKTTTK